MARPLNPMRRHRQGGYRRSDPAPGHPLHTYLHAYCEWALVTGLALETVSTRQSAILRFIVWCDERGIVSPAEITRPMLESYQRGLHLHRKKNGHPLSSGLQLGLLIALGGWFRWMVRQHYVQANPAADLELPKKAKTLPKTILSVQQAETIINQADTGTALGLRNRAIMEVLYSTGIRRAELTCLKHYDLDTEHGTLVVRQGKGGKDRFLPIGERACKWTDKYLTDVRPDLVAGYDDHTLFLNDFGQPMTADFLGDLVRRHVEAAGISTGGACHLFRHAMATHMLENGADIRFIQAMLGHANLQTTEIYTHVSIGKLREIHKATHPARLHRVRDDQHGAAGANIGDDAQTLRDALDDEETPD
jgi:integrase/recombinase XerD